MPPIKKRNDRLRVRELRESDELRRRIGVLALTCAFILAICAFLLLTLFRMVDLHIALRPLWAFWLLFGSYLLTRHRLQRRFE